ncbi:MAG: hypothetical protein HYX60_02180, partial [Legionella longbeachae]|nr:hypothetical protein [Legionella longbeachae]
MLNGSKKLITKKYNDNCSENINKENTLILDKQNPMESVKDKWNILAPYPKPSQKQDTIVKRVESFASTLKNITEFIELTIGVPIKLNPVSRLFTKFSNIREAKFWNQRVQAIPTDELISPKQEAVYVANTHEAMDHYFFYVLKHGRIWHKPIAAPKISQWKLFGPDGLPPSGVKLEAISSDGANLIALDTSGIIHYVHTSRIQFFITETSWKITEIKLDWTDQW